ncbi:MAG: hypothetical protein IPM82_30285 [Saprospiraceae bacterium]|nr:hypothetical protein [Saprospiraceae bacterium]
MLKKHEAQRRCGKKKVHRPAGVAHHSLKFSAKLSEKEEENYATLLPVRFYTRRYGKKN